MFRTSDRIVAAQGSASVRGTRTESRHSKGVDHVALADARTSMCDWRIAVATTLDLACDRNGFIEPAAGA